MVWLPSRDLLIGLASLALFVGAVVALACRPVDGGAVVVGNPLPKGFKKLTKYTLPWYAKRFPLFHLSAEGGRAAREFYCGGGNLRWRELVIRSETNSVTAVEFHVDGATAGDAAPIAMLHHPSMRIEGMSGRLAHALHRAGFRVLAVPPSGVTGGYMVDHARWYLGVVAAVRRSNTKPPMVLIGASGGAELLAIALLQRDKVLGVDAVALLGCPWQRMKSKGGSAVATTEMDVTRIPTLIVNALDDPVYSVIDEGEGPATADPRGWRKDCAADLEQLKDAPGVVLAYAESGSHCAFHEAWTVPGASSWAEKLVVAFARDKARLV